MTSDVFQVCIRTGLKNPNCTSFFTINIYKVVWTKNKQFIYTSSGNLRPFSHSRWPAISYILPCILDTCQIFSSSSHHYRIVNVYPCHHQSLKFCSLHLITISDTYFSNQQPIKAGVLMSAVHYSSIYLPRESSRLLRRKAVTSGSESDGTSSCQCIAGSASYHQQLMKKVGSMAGMLLLPQ